MLIGWLNPWQVKSQRFDMVQAFKNSCGAWWGHIAGQDVGKLWLKNAKKKHIWLHWTLLNFNEQIACKVQKLPFLQCWFARNKMVCRWHYLDRTWSSSVNSADCFYTSSKFWVWVGDAAGSFQPVGQLYDLSWGFSIRTVSPTADLRPNSCT